MFKLPNYYKESFTMYVWTIELSTRRLQARELTRMDKECSYLAQVRKSGYAY